MPAYRHGISDASDRRALEIASRSPLVGDVPLSCSGLFRKTNVGERSGLLLEVAGDHCPLSTLSTCSCCVDGRVVAGSSEVGGTAGEATGGTLATVMTGASAITGATGATAAVGGGRA